MDRPRTEPRDVFIYLLAMVTLYASACAVITLLFQYVNLGFPDPLDSGGYVSEKIRWSLAELIILFPVYFWSTRVLEGEAASDPSKAAMRIRRWMLCLTLFLAGLLIIGDLVCLIYKFLGGELTMRFVLKVASIVAVAGAIFAYYRDALRRSGEIPPRERTFAIAATGVVAAIVAVGVFNAGSPARARLVAFDEQRANDLRSIQKEIVSYWQAKDRLPATLTDLTDSISGFTAPSDPVTHRAYAYRATGVDSFELCADFDLAGKEERTYLFGREDRLGGWKHNSGRVCYARHIDPAKYPPNATAKTPAPGAAAPEAAMTPAAAAR
jgi:hypothetical protein